MRERGLVFPGLVPLGSAELDAVLRIADRHLELAAEICRFDPAAVKTGEGSRGISFTEHEALLAVAAIRRAEQESGQWAAYGGLSAGCMPALLAAGVLTEESCFRVIYEINSRQAAAHRARPSGSTLSVLAASEGDVRRLVEMVRIKDDSAWLAVDLGGGLVSISVRNPDPGPVTALLERFGLEVLDVTERAEHCPYAVPGEQEFAEFLSDIDFFPAAAPVVSAIDGKVVGNSPEEFRKMLARQWLDTVSMPALIQGICAIDGVRGVDLVSPAGSVYRNRVRSLLAGRAAYRLFAFSDQGLPGGPTEES